MEPTSDTRWKEEEAARKAEDAKALAHPVNIDGHKLTLSDLFSHAHEAREFKGKLNLLASTPGSKPSVEDALFSAPKTPATTTVAAGVPVGTIGGVAGGDA